MSFGRTPNIDIYKITPPERGSFPLDHEGECKKLMLEYLKCLKQNNGNNGNCRHLSKSYLKCRMEKGLMLSDDMKNLGFHDESNNNQII
nr:13170_t:CDS:2 [Entrophospora candida]